MIRRCSFFPDKPLINKRESTDLISRVDLFQISQDGSKEIYNRSSFPGHRMITIWFSRSAEFQGLSKILFWSFIVTLFYEFSNLSFRSVFRDESTSLRTTIVSL